MSNTALVVDDSTSMRQMVCCTLKQAGFEVIEAGDGQQALDSLNNQPVDVVITDLNMPVLNGLELIRRLRSLPTYRFTPILMLTTESQQAKKLEGKQAGATGWIVKPFNPDRLLDVIRKVVRLTESYEHAN